MANLGRVELATIDVIAVLPRCKDCRWWSTEHRLGWLSDRSDGRGHCERAESEDGQPVDKDSLAYTEDGESYRAILITAPDFGCVQFQARET